MRNVYNVIIIIIFNSFLNTNQIYAETKNELSFSLATGNGIMENVKGMHTPVTNNPGTNIKGLVLDDDSLNMDDILDQLVICGDVNQVVDQILAFREEVGDFGELLYGGVDWVDESLARKSMELMAEKVIPEVNKYINK